MRYHLAPLYCRPWTLNGISPRLIESHYENNYGAALNRLNAISEEIEQLDLGKTSDQSLAPYGQKIKSKRKSGNYLIPA